METSLENTNDSQESRGRGLMLGLLVLVFLVAGAFYMLLGSSKNKTLTSEVKQDGLSQGQPVVIGEDASEVTIGKDNGEIGQTAGDEVEVITVEGGMFYFKPDKIIVKKGQAVKVVFKNVEGMHDFVVDELNVRTPVIRGDKTAEVSFTPDKSGEFEFYCSVGNHRAQGMKGILVVE